MAAEAIFRHGDPIFIDYTPGAGNVAAGQVVVLGNTAGLACGVAHVDIPNNVLGALGSGGGVYEVKNLNNAANYAKVWWDDANNGASTTSTNNAQFGYVVRNGGGGVNTACFVKHDPHV
jgi:hypothetical protein